MLDQALHGGRAGRIYRKLVLEQQIAVDTEGGIHYPVGDLFDYNGPTLMVTRILHKPEYSADQTLAAYDAVLDEMKQKGNHRRGTGTDQGEVPLELFFHARGRARRLHSALRADAPTWRVSRSSTTIRTLVNTILGGFMEVTPERVQSVAQKLLTRHNRSIVIRQPAKKGAA